MNSPAATRPKPVILKPGEGSAITAFENTIVTKLSAGDTGGAFSLGLLIAQPKSGPPLHRHSREDELFIVTSGRFRFVCDGDSHDAEPGSVIFLPRQTVHTFMVTGNEPAQAWVMAIPSGFENFFGRCAAEFRNGFAPDPADLQKLGQEFGIEFPGPPLAALTKG